MGCGKGWGPAAMGCPALPSQPLAHVRTPLWCTCHCASSIIVHALSCTLCLRARSVTLHTPSLCVLHRCARSIVLHALSSCVLCHACSIMHAPSPCTLLRHTHLWSLRTTPNSAAGGRVGSAWGPMPIAGTRAPSPPATAATAPAHPRPARVNAGGGGCLRDLVPVQK